MSSSNGSKERLKIVYVFGDCAAAAFVGCLVGGIMFMIGVNLFSLELAPDQRDPALGAAVFACGFASLGGVGGYRIGRNLLEYIPWWNT